MGAENSKEKQYYIELNIDKQQYAIKDQIKGYITYYANPFLYQEYNESFANRNLELRLEFIGYYLQTQWENMSIFISKDELIKTCIYGNERKINEKVAFTYDLDLITQSGYESSNFKINYFLRATIKSKNQIIEKKEINFLIYRPFIDIERPISKDYSFSVKSMICCNFGQIYVKVSLNKTDFVINDIAKILIKCDQSLSTKNISNFQIDLLSKSFISEENTYLQRYNTMFSQAQLDQKFQYIQEFPITSNRLSSCINQSLDCPITCNTGKLTNSSTFSLPIIVQKTYEQTLKDVKNNIEIHEPFNEDIFDEFRKIKLLDFQIKQEKWKDQIIEFYDNNIQLAQQQPEEGTNLIIIK